MILLLLAGGPTNYHLSLPQPVTRDGNIWEYAGVGPARTLRHKNELQLAK